MNTITKYGVFLLFSLLVTNLNAQEDEQYEATPKEIEALKENIRAYEKEALKVEVEAINKRVSDKEITYEQGEELKQEAAKKRALNIEERILILENRIAFNKRNNLPFPYSKRSNKKGKVSISFGDNSSNPLGLKISNTEKKPVKYDVRTVSGLVYSAGFNNAILDGQSLSDSPYKTSGSGFIELGFQFRTRLLKNSNLARLRYGVSFQWNKYILDDNKYFVKDGNTTTIEEFPINLKEAKFRTTNIVLPVYLEFGQSKKIEKPDNIRFITKGLRGGFGGYAGLNIGAVQKLKYEEDGDKVKQKMKTDYNLNPFVYGVGAYVGYGNISLFAKYDLSETFKSNGPKQNNVSLGLRFELE